MKKLALLLLIPFTLKADNVLTPAERVVALTILGEARGEGKRGMFAVACVIQRRSVNREISPDRVCLQRKQFSIWNGKQEKDLWHLWNSKEKMYARELARHVCSDKVWLMEITKGADHYCNTKFNPQWAKGKKPVIIIGNHKFYRLND